MTAKSLVLTSSKGLERRMQSNFMLLNEDSFWALMSWARYLAFADILRETYEASLELPDDAPVEERNFPAYTPLLSSQRSARLRKDAAFAYYHSSLLPVIEGWKELALTDERVDGGLNSSKNSLHPQHWTPQLIQSAMLRASRRYPLSSVTASSIPA
jgi:hypothetical protein